MTTIHRIFLLASLALGATGCDLFGEEREGPLERAGDEIDDTAEDIDDGLEDIGEDIDESVGH